VRRASLAAGLRFSVMYRRFHGAHDVVLRSHRVATCVNGCFWHRNLSCRYATTPTTRIKFWQQKSGQKCPGRAERVIRRDRGSKTENCPRKRGSSTSVHYAPDFKADWSQLCP